MGTQVLDPVTRIEGHLRVELTGPASGATGVTTNAKCMAEMFRGYENILVGRNPTDAVQITQRI